jgi:PST family polysaccharide transporter
LHRREMFDPPASNLRRQVTHGAAHTGAAQAVRLLTQIGSALVLSRLLSPADFGLVAMAWPILAFANLFQDLGLSQAVVQKSSITREEINTLFWINITVSGGLAFILALLGPLVGIFYRDERTGFLTSAMSLTTLASGFGAQPGAILNRRMEFGFLAIIDAAGAIAGLSISVAWALIAPSYWALYAGALVSALVATLGSWLAAGWAPSRPRLAAGWRELLNFGAGLTGFNVANFFARNFDNVLIGRFLGTVALGLYDRAYKLLLFPLQQINNPLSRVMYPALSRLVADPGRYRSAYLRTLGQLLLVVLPGVAFMTATADDLIPILLGEKWRAAGPIFGALGFAGLLQPLNNTSGWLFISQGRTSEFMRWGILGAVTSVIAFTMGLPYGPFGVAAAYAASEYFRTPLLWWYVARRGPIGVYDVMRTALPHLAGVAASLLGLWVTPKFPISSPIFGLVIALLLSYAISLLVILSFPAGRETITQSVSLAGGLWRRLRKG